MLAHDAHPLAPHHVWSAWSWEPGVIALLLVSGWLYINGLTALWQVAGRGHGIRRWEAAAFAGGWLSLAAAMISPLHRLGGVLFSAHMAQHELIMVVAAPLMVLGRPIIAFLWAVPPAWRRAAGDIAGHAWVERPWAVLSLPLVAWTLHAVAI